MEPSGFFCIVLIKYILLLKFFKNGISRFEETTVVFLLFVFTLLLQID
jgi:hypothetical protein